LHSTALRGAVRVNTLQVTEGSDALARRAVKILGKRIIFTANRQV